MLADDKNRRQDGVTQERTEKCGKGQVTENPENELMIDKSQYSSAAQQTAQNHTGQSGTQFIAIWCSD